MRESLLQGASAYLESIFPFRDRVVKERMQVLSRDETGRARQVVGSFVIEQYNHDAYLDAAFSLTNAPIKLDTGSDVTRQAKGMLLFAINSTGDGLWDWDATNNHVYYSPRYLSMLGYTTEEFPGCLEAWAQKIHPDDRPRILQPQADIVASPRYGDTFECTYRLLRKDGTYAWILGRGFVTQRDATGRAVRLIGMHADITQVQHERDRLEELVKNDALTGLRSRYFCDLEVARLEKSNIRPVCVMSVDITGLKLINDEMGHATGDKLLTTAALLLREPLRATDCVARMGGDEFVVLLPGCSLERGKALVGEIQNSFARHNEQKKAFPIFVGIGMAHTEDSTESVSTLLRQADMHMLKNKKLHRAVALKAIVDWIEECKGSTVCFKDWRTSI